MSDPLKLYEKGIEYLLHDLGSAHPDYEDVSVLQTRLYENIYGTQVYGSNEKAERTQIIRQLNSVTQRIYSKRFLQYCKMKEAADQSEVKAANPETQTSSPAQDTTTSPTSPVCDAPSQNASTTYTDDKLSQAHQYLKAVQTAAQAADSLFDDPHKLWYERCMIICTSFQSIKRPLLLKTSALNPLKVHLSLIHEQVNTVIEFLSIFCSDCEKTTQRVQHRRADISRRLKLIIQECEKQLTSHT